MRLRLFTAVGVLLCLGAVSMTNGPTVVTASTASPAFTGAQLSAPPSTDWISPGGNIQNQRYSSLNQINTGTSRGSSWPGRRTSTSRVWRKKYSAGGDAARLQRRHVHLHRQQRRLRARRDDTAPASGRPLGHRSEQRHGLLRLGQPRRGDRRRQGLRRRSSTAGSSPSTRTTGNVVWKVRNVRWQDGATMTMAPLVLQRHGLRRDVGRRVRRPRQRDRLRRGHRRLQVAVLHRPVAGRHRLGTWPSNNEWQTGGATVWNNPSIDPVTNR